MATDYRLRYYFDITEANRLAASRGASLLTASSSPARAQEKGALFSEFFQYLSERIRLLEPRGRALSAKSEEELCRLCLVLSQFEEAFRSGRENSKLRDLTHLSSLDDILNIPEESWVEDLASVSALFYRTQADFLLPRHAICNPTFKGSPQISGADADLILDRCLVEIKATTRPKRLDEGQLYQLLGYVLLDWEDEFEMQEVAIYLARQGIFVEWNIEELVSVLAQGPTSVGGLRSDFKNLLRDRGN